MVIFSTVFNESICFFYEHLEAHKDRQQTALHHPDRGTTDEEYFAIYNKIDIYRVEEISSKIISVSLCPN